MATAPNYPLRDPIGNYNFSISIGSVIAGNFKEMSGLSVSRAVNDYREGHEATLQPRKIPGLRSLSNVTLKRGFIEEQELWSWCEMNRHEKNFKQDVDLVVFNDQFDEIARWTLKNAWPTRWSAPSFDATSTGLAMEEIELAFDDVALVQ